MLDGNEEGISRIVVPIVAPAVVLHLYDERLQLAYIGVKKERPKERVIPVVLSLVADEDSHDAAGLDFLKKSFHRTVQPQLKLFKSPAVAKVVRVIGVADNVPVRRVVPDKVELPFRQVSGEDVPTMPKVSALVINLRSKKLVDACHHIPHGPAALGRVENALATESQDKIFDQIP